MATQTQCEEDVVILMLFIMFTPCRQNGIAVLKHDFSSLVTVMPWYRDEYEQYEILSLKHSGFQSETEQEKCCINA